MRVLWLGPSRQNLSDYLESVGDEVSIVDYPITALSDCLASIEFIVSYGYRYILKRDVLEKFRSRAINLHISLLPWNRGADPNLWSFLEDTPKGVTIHCLDEGIDTGDIIAQAHVEIYELDTLRTSYNRLSDSIERLFVEKWPEIRTGKTSPISQSSGGSCHYSRDRNKYEYLLQNGWDTPVKGLIGKALGKEK